VGISKRTMHATFSSEALLLDELTLAKAGVNVCVAATRAGCDVEAVRELLDMLGVNAASARRLLPEIKRDRLLAEERYATANHEED
jgi:hypothetical protein